MFPGMMGPPQTPPEESYNRFWSCAAHFALFTATVVAISIGIRYAEDKTADSMAMLGGFVPRGWAQMAKDPAFCFFSFALGFWWGEYVVLNIKMGANSLVPDPHRYVYQISQDHGH